MQTGAQLGGVAASFTAKLGPPMRDTGLIVQFQKCPGRTALVRWQIGIDQGHVTTIIRNACEGEKLDPADDRRPPSYDVYVGRRAFVRVRRRRIASARRLIPTKAIDAGSGTALAVTEGFHERLSYGPFV